VISDLHIGSGGKRDNLTSRNKRKLLSSFLDYVETTGGELFIIGDLLELWHCRLESILAAHTELFYRLAEMDCTYILGNHDEGLAELSDEAGLRHPLFGKITNPRMRKIGGRIFKFMHGHEVDPFIRKPSRTLCRVLAPVVDLLHSNSDSPVLAYDLFSDLALEIGEAALTVWQRLRELTKRAADDCLAVLPNEEVALLKRYCRTRKMLRRYRQDLNEGLYDAAVVGHTHKSGRFSDWYFNSGSWIGPRNNFLSILPDGIVELFDWGPLGPKLSETCIGR
jgi:UDP-2,3-diacylglucosamine pyrophosphatase LpxH